MKRSLPAIIVLCLMMLASEGGRAFMPELNVIWRITEGVLLNGIMAFAMIYSLMKERL